MYATTTRRLPIRWSLCKQLTFGDLLDLALVSEALGEAPSSGRISVLLHYGMIRVYESDVAVLAMRMSRTRRNGAREEMLCTVVRAASGAASRSGVVQVIVERAEDVLLASRSKKQRRQKVLSWRMVVVCS